MKILYINNFENGLVSDIDGIDIPANGLADLKGLRIRPGFLRSYYPPSQLSQISYTTPKSLAELKMFKTATTTERMLLYQDGSTIYKNIYSGGYGTFASIGTFNADKAKYMVAQKNLYIIPDGLDYQHDTKKYLYINNRKYFNNAINYNNWYFATAFLGRPDTSDYTLSASGSGSMSGKYFVRLTFEYDGYQESCWQDRNGNSQRYIDATGATYFQIDINLDSSTINKRITAVNIYVAYNLKVPSTNPSTGWYLAGRVDINDSNWSLSSGTTYQISVIIGLTGGGSSSDFPNNHYSGGFDDPLDNFESELYTKTNSVINKAYWGVESYGDAVFVNSRLFVIKPGIDYENLPYDPRQVLLFSQVNKPDEIQFLVDYIDVSTDEGDQCVALVEVNDIILVLKKRSLFKINMFNSGNVMDWQVSDPIKGVGCITKHGVQKIQGLVIFPGLSDIFMTDGNDFIGITKNKIQDEYRNLISSESDYDDISSGVDFINMAYWIYFPTSDIILKYYIEEKRWEKFDASDVHSFYIIANGIEDIPIGINIDDNPGVVKIEDSSASGTSISNILETGWISLNGDPLMEKQIRWIKLIGKFNNGAIHLYVYKDFESSEIITKTITATTDRILFEETSLLAKVIKIKISTSSTNTDNKLFELQGIEVGYEELGNR
ncbi:MAG: hypothetical protein ACP6IQ_10575 [Candidatus Njordarchaeia archaeon]